MISTLGKRVESFATGLLILRFQQRTDRGRGRYDGSLITQHDYVLPAMIQ
ncbi:hypothetical protein [Calycomorphotria hydatis]|nr:hypothetical protein [Calycomorphotria hydatis]